MSAWNWLKSLFGAPPARSSERVYIVDAVDLLGGRPGRSSPRDMLTLLQRLGHFAQKEKMELQAVFQGEELRRAPDGDAFNGVTVHYAADTASRPAFIADLVRKTVRRSSRVTLIASDPELEQRVVAAGGHVLRTATFRKALDGGSGGEGGGRRGEGGGRRGEGGGRRGEGGGSGGRSSRRRGGRRGGRGRSEAAARGEPGGAEPSGPKPGGDGISDLIDLVE